MRGISFWHDSLPAGDDLAPRPALPGDLDVDVAIVGAGYTGLWTAHSLLRADPSLRVVLLEREVAGFGASGRNGGWCVGHYSGPPAAANRKGGAGAYATMEREVRRAVDEVGAVVAEAGIECGFHKGGALYFAVNEGQMRRVRKLHAGFERQGVGDGWKLLDADAAAAIAAVPGIRGLATEVERLGGTIHEGTAVRSLGDRVVHTEHGSVRADVVVLGTEAYTSSIEGHEADIFALGNHMVATEPIDDATWRQIGFANRELFELSMILLGYGQRTADGRIAWGGLAAQCWKRGQIPPSPMNNPQAEERLRRMLVRLFPPLEGIGFTHSWGGVLGVPRDQLPGIGFDRATGFAWAGGYTGQGVAAANSAGRGLADLIRGVDSDIAKLPWVGHRSRRWEPEPIPRTGVQAFMSLARLKDGFDARREGRRR